MITFVYVLQNVAQTSLHWYVHSHFPLSQKIDLLVVLVSVVLGEISSLEIWFWRSSEVAAPNAVTNTFAPALSLAVKNTSLCNAFLNRLSVLTLLLHQLFLVYGVIKEIRICCFYTQQNPTLRFFKSTSFILLQVFLELAEELFTLLVFTVRSQISCREVLRATTLRLFRVCLYDPMLLILQEEPVLLVQTDGAKCFKAMQNPQQPLNVQVFRQLVLTFFEVRLIEIGPLVLFIATKAQFDVGQQVLNNCLERESECLSIRDKFVNEV